jgi:uncharacterized Fe-S cluster-containing radical SAM superfamily enzyme
MIINPKDSEQVKKGLEYYTKLSKGNCYYEIKRIVKKKSVSNNAYLHVCINLFAIEFGYNSDESKTILKRECNFMVYEKNGTKFLKRIRDFNDKECADFITWIRNYSSSNGYYIPTPEEYILHQFEIDKHIKKHQEFL